MSTIILSLKKSYQTFRTARLVPVVAGLLCFGQSFAQLTVQGGLTPAQLVDSLLGPGVTVSNITYTGAATASGFFDGTASNLGIGKGIMLTSGDIINAPGPNVNMGAGTDNGLPGDADLTALAAVNTNDACILEFDFTVPSDTVKIRYVFGSEEYNEYVCANFNDIFAFFISGPGISGTQNIALIPGTTFPVSINNVNNGTIGIFGGGGPQCNLVNSAYFFDNDNPPGLTVEYDGFTVVLEAVVAVIPCGTYHIKIAIADASDGVLDSGVFLEQGSFSGVLTSAAATANPIIACAPATVNFTNNSAGASLYAWNFDDGSPIDSSMNPSHVFTNPGVYNVQLIATGALACGGISDTTYVTVTVTTNVPVNLGPDTSLCAGTAIVLGYGIISGTSYLWSTGDTTSYIIITTPGTYSVTVTSALCPAGTDTINVTLTTLGLNIGNDTTLCTGQSVTLTGNITGTHYQWSTGDTTSSLTITAPGTYWMVITANGCQDVDTIQVFFGNPAGVNLGNDTTICPGQSITLGNNLTGTIFNWSTGDTTQTINVNIPGIYWVAAGPPGCQGIDTITISSAPAPVVYLGNDTTLCAGNILQLDAGSHSSYIWSTGATTSSINVTSTGTYYVGVNDGGCTGGDSIYVQFTPLPVVNLGPNLSFCTGMSDTLDAGNPGATYSWSTGSNSQTIVVNTSGTYTVTVTVSGCSASGSIMVTENPLPVVVLTNDTSICPGNSVNLNASGGNSYSWTPSTGLSSSIVPNPTANPAGTITYTVTVTDGNNCSASKSMTITVNALPSITTIADTVICEGSSITLNAQGGVSYSWTGQHLDNPASSSPVATPPVSTTYQVTGTDANGCQNSASVNIGVASVPTASFTWHFDISCLGTRGIFTNNSVNASQYLWDFGDGTTSAEANVVHDFAVGITGTISLTAYNSGCSSETTIPIPDPLTLKTNVPNIFTPNGDPFNSCFGLDSLNGFESCFSIEIFNRWGNSVYQSDNAHDCWDGTTGSNQAPAGVYFYVLKIANNEFKGTIELVR